LCTPPPVIVKKHFDDFSVRDTLVYRIANTCTSPEARIHYSTRLNLDHFSASRAGWSGLTAIISFIIIALTSLPTFRRKHYEIFQLAHLLMYRKLIRSSYLCKPTDIALTLFLVIFTMLAIHGTANLRKYKHAHLHNARATGYA
jgi:hypothetical protein